MGIPESKLVYFAEIGNTNTEIMSNLLPYEDGDGVYTTHQLQGKGTRGRRWEEVQGKNLAISFLYHLPLLALSPLPLVVGLGVRGGIKDYCGLETFLKWSNDIVGENKKLVGILCESRLESGVARVVVGAGINLTHTKEELAREGLSQATSLSALGVDTVDPHQLAKAIQRQMHRVMGIYFRSGFPGELQQEYEKYCLTLGREIQILRPNQPPQSSQGVGISPEGALRCLSSTGEEFSVYSGDVSVRGLEGYI